MYNVFMAQAALENRLGVIKIPNPDNCKDSEGRCCVYLRAFNEFTSPPLRDNRCVAAMRFANEISLAELRRTPFNTIAPEDAVDCINKFTQSVILCALAKSSESL